MDNFKAENVIPEINTIWDMLLGNDKEGTCCICGKHYDNYGNNAKPYKEGRLNSFLESMLGVTNSEIEKFTEHTEVFSKVKSLISKNTQIMEKKRFFFVHITDSLM